MNTYQQVSYKNYLNEEILDNQGIMLLPSTYIPFVLENTDYQNFKTFVSNDEAIVETPNGDAMTSQEAKAYIATLP